MAVMVGPISWSGGRTADVTRSLRVCAAGPLGELAGSDHVRDLRDDRAAIGVQWSVHFENLLTLMEVPRERKRVRDPDAWD